MAIRSMTGFARVSRSTPSGELTLSIKTVNHRGLDMHFHMPMGFDAIEPLLRSAVRKRVTRGHVQVQLFFKKNSGGAGSAAINEPLLKEWLDSYRAVAARLGIDSPPDLNQALRLPGMMETREDPAPDAELEAVAVAAAGEVLDQLDDFRIREGAALEAELRARVDSICGLTARMKDIRTRALPQFQHRLRERLGELLGGSAQIDAARLAQEAAILAERSDISEELVRLKTHSEQLAALLSAEGETGKKLDFLLQEMNREANTLLSKTGGLGENGLTLTDLGLAVKAEIDRIREQSLNIE